MSAWDDLPFFFILLWDYYLPDRGRSAGASSTTCQSLGYWVSLASVPGTPKASHEHTTRKMSPLNQFVSAKCDSRDTLCTHLAKFVYGMNPNGFFLLALGLTSQGEPLSMAYPLPSSSCSSSS